MKYIIYSKENDGYWSNEYGWAEYQEQASVYDESEISDTNLPIIGVADAKWIEYKHNLNNYRVELYESEESDFVIIFECQAEDTSHAIEQTLDMYPSGDVISVYKI